jgi:limonene-1,2-epoxide hydrolase
MTNLRNTILFTLFMTLLMGLALAAFFTLQAQGLTEGFVQEWLTRFFSVYVLVLPTVVVVGPIARALTRLIETWLDRRSGAANATPASQVVDPVAVALEAWRRNGVGHGGGSFEPLYEILHDDVVITMPLGQFRGENHGIAAARQIYEAIAAANPRFVYESPLHVAQQGQTVLIEFDDHGTIAGFPYRNRIVGSYDIRGNKVAAYREYFGDIDPEIVRMMTAS